MSRPSRRLAAAATSALGITALTLGLSAPAGAAPITALDDPEAISAAADELLDSPITDLLPDAPGLAPEGAAASRLAGTLAADEGTPTSSVDVEEIDRTETSATFRFTLPPGETTREDAVLQAYSFGLGYRISALTWWTDPAAGMGARHDEAYADQLVALQLADLVRSNFSVSGGVATSSAMQDHFTVPPGSNSFDITVTSLRTETELAEAIRAIISTTGGDPDETEWMAGFLLESRLALPSSGGELIWHYGERTPVLNPAAGAFGYPNGLNELTVERTGTIYDSTTTITRSDGEGFSGDRLLGIQRQQEILGDVPVIGEIADLMSGFYAPPLRPGEITTQVSGATHVRDGYYRPTLGVEQVEVRFTGTGPKTEAEARSRFTTWVTETCDAELTDTIAGLPDLEGEGPITWQEYLDAAVGVYDQADEGSSNDLVVYTDEAFIDTIRQEMAEQMAALIEMLPVMIGVSPDLEDSADIWEAMLPDWDEACGTSTDDPGEDSEAPANITVTAPEGGVAGEPLTLSATVLDKNGVPVVGQQVTFSITEDAAESAPVAGTLRAAALTLTAAADGPTVLTATTGADGVATVQYTPTRSGTLRVTASTGGDTPITSEEAPIPVAPEETGGGAPGPGDGGGGPGPGDGGGDDGPGDGNGGSGSLGSLFGSLGS